MQKDNYIVGDKVELCSLNSENRDEYLKVFKIASNFAELFSTSEELWRTMSGMIGKDSDKIIRFVIRINNDKRTCGYINYEFEKDMPSIDIAIEPQYRNNGYGYEAAKLLCEYLLSQKKIDAVLWHTMPKNIASIRIAKKLGGKRIDGKSIIEWSMVEKFEDETIENNEIPEVFTYVIK